MDRKGLKAYALEVERQTKELKTRLKRNYKELDYTTKSLEGVINNCGLEEGLKSKILKEAEVELMEIELTLDRVRDKVPLWEDKIKRLKKIIKEGGK